MTQASKPTRHNAALPVVLFSHGLGGTRDGGAVWGEAWAAADFVVVHLQDDADARARLIAPAGLRPGDRWQQK